MALAVLPFLLFLSVVCLGSVSVNGCDCNGCESYTFGHSSQLTLSGASITCPTGNPPQQATLQSVTVQSTSGAFGIDPCSWTVQYQDGSNGNGWNNAGITSGSTHCAGPVSVYASTNALAGVVVQCQNSVLDCDTYVTFGTTACIQPGSDASHACAAGCSSNYALCCNNGDTTYLDNNFCYCEPAAGVPPPSNSYNWVYTSTSGCIGSCGTGTQTVYYTCEDQNGNAVADSNCAQPNPTGTQSCSLSPCPEPSSTAAPVSNTNPPSTNPSTPTPPPDSDYYTCDCCVGNYCTPSLVGYVATSTCSSDAADPCRAAFPSNCPQSSDSGEVAGFCGQLNSSGATKTNDAAVSSGSLRAVGIVALSTTVALAVLGA